MTLSRHQLHHRAACARFQAGKQKPPTRKQARAWLAPIRNAMAEMRTGYVDSHRGYAITRIHWADEDFARIDHAINGFVALMVRLMPDLDVGPMTKLSKKLESGVLITLPELNACSTLLKTVEDRLLTFRRCDLVDAANIEMIAIEVERLGLNAGSNGPSGVAAKVRVD